MPYLLDRGMHLVYMVCRITTACSQ